MTNTLDKDMLLNCAFDYGQLFSHKKNHSLKTLEFLSRLSFIRDSVIWFVINSLSGLISYLIIVFVSVLSMPNSDTFMPQEKLTWKVLSDGILIFYGSSLSISVATDYYFSKSHVSKGFFALALVIPALILGCVGMIFVYLLCQNEGLIQKETMEKVQHIVFIVSLIFSLAFKMVLFNKES